MTTRWLNPRHTSVASRYVCLSGNSSPIIRVLFSYSLSFFFVHSQWVNYFLHSGHLHIEGLKMSKSLKNFIKIKEALAVNDKRQIRMLYLLCKWNTEMNYSDGALDTAATKLTFFNNFFQNIKTIIREKGNKCSQKWNDEENQLHK